MSVKLNNLSLSFGEIIIADDITIDFPDTGLYLITGQSGCGKSTLLNIIAGLVKANSGLVDAPPVSYAFQDDRLFPWRRVLKNAVCSGDKEKALDYLNRLGLSDSLNLYPRQLSGGMQRRVSLARAFAFDAPVLLLDEPFRGLDKELQSIVAELIVEQSKARLVICSTHEPELFEKAHVYSLSNGKLQSL